MIEILKYILLGLAQGVAEVLPISSSAHLEIMSQILNISDYSFTFKIFLHFASLIATIFFLRKRLIFLIKGFFLYIFTKKEIDENGNVNTEKKDKYKYEFKYCIMIVIATIPAVIITLLLGDYIEGLSSILWVIGILLIINGISLFLFSLIKPRENQTMNYLDAIVIGTFQCAGLFCGISRSGSCICGAMSRKLSKENVADFVFLMLVPAVLGATVLSLKDIGQFMLNKNQIHLYVISFVVTLVVTYFSFKILMAVIKSSKFWVFSIYCILMGAFALIYGLVK